MLLKRQYQHDPEGIKPPVVVGVHLKSEAGERIHFTPETVRAATKQGWMTISGSVLILQPSNTSSVRYRIKREPGYYCCHCGSEIEDANQVLDGGITVGQRHVSQFHNGTTSPDPSNPAGYEKINYYDCVKE